VRYSDPMPAARVTLGSEVLLDSGRLAGLRVAVVANPASIDGAFRHIVDRLARAPGVRLAALFGPQHGVYADVQDNMVESPHGRHPRYGVPIYSLYSETREPTPAMLEGLDAIVVDLQDVGTRVYTFAATMANVLRAAARAGLRVFVCDRPNPIGGEQVEGPVLRPAFASFVGPFPIPLRHGLTLGELARLFNGPFGLGAPLEVVPMRGWARSMLWDDTGLPWVPPSPNMPSPDTALVYPGTVLFEGTNLSEGRGTTRPFEFVGAPWIDGDALAEAMNREALPGVCFRPAVFEPTFQKHAQRPCGGCQIHVTDRRAFRPVLTGVALLAACRAQHPVRFAWREPPYEYETVKWPIDILYGSDELRTGLEAGVSVRALADRWEEECRRFEALRRSVLLY
jgi:uncharacterized protein YbbC (DUF1343 family)